MIHPERCLALNTREPGRGRYVLYWMQASQRAACNHALEAAIRRANSLDLPVVVGFGLMDDYPEANQRHYAFLLEGLADAHAALCQRGIPLVLRRGHPAAVALDLAREAAFLVCDRGYLRHQRQWRQQVADQAPCPVEQVETDAIVPAAAASDKEEFAARTLRPKIHRQLPHFLVPLRESRPKRAGLDLSLAGEDAADVDGLLARLRIDRSVPRVRDFRGGHTQADRLLSAFLARKLPDYPQARNQPAQDHVSHLSPYLHFGHISPLEIALRVRAAPAPREAQDAYLEELIVRRELSINFVLHNPRYDQYECLPAWARATLERHAADPRRRVYSAADLEQARTHDPYWNAAQREMVLTGKMHNYMRMYWGKKILEWSATPAEAFATALRLNNKYELDGRDPNSYAGVAWCFGKHDRPWGERAVFGTIRYMNDAGLKRKCDIQAYVDKVRSRETQA